MTIPSFKNCSSVEELARGGQKIVYKAIHNSWGNVVIKVGKTNSTSGKARIQREINLLSALNSVYYPKQYSFELNNPNKLESDFVIIEELIEGETLRVSINKFKSEEQIIKLLKYLFEGLNLIWYNPDGKTVHRDLKPENIIIRPDKTPCILDLGIARLLYEESLTPSIFPHGPCTPNYASPEQLRNDKSLIDARSDFFSLGIIAAELYLGHHPFDSNYLNSIQSIPENIIGGTHFDLSSKNASIKFCKLINKLLKPKPYQRFRNVKAILKHLNS